MRLGAAISPHPGDVVGFANGDSESQQTQSERGKVNHMSDEYGPIEFLMILVPEGGTLPTLLSVVAAELSTTAVRLLDAVVIARSSTGELTFAELEDQSELGEVVLAAEGITSDEDALHLAASLPAGARALLLTIESVWLKRLADATTAAGGDVIHADRIPAVIVNAAAAALS